MRKELVYSAIALTAIPVTVNANDVQAVSKDALSSPTGAEISENLGTLVPGKYTFKGKLTSKIYGVNIKIVDAKDNVITELKEQKGNEVDVATTQFELKEATTLKVVLVSSDPGVSGAEFELGAPVVNLTFDFAVAIGNLTDAATTAKNTINGFKYAAKDEDVQAATNLITEIGKIKETYDDYKTFELYNLIDGAEATKINHLLSDATYEQVNFEILAIKEIYNAAVVDLKAELVDASAYLLDGALKKLSDDIDANITKAQNANYQSKQAYTAATDAATNRALIPTEKAIKDIKDDYTTQSTNNKTAYKNLADHLKTLQANFDAVKTGAGVTLTDAEKKTQTEAQAAINAVKALIDNAYDSKDQLTLSTAKAYTDADAAAGTKTTAYANAVANANGNQAGLDDIAKLETNYGKAKATAAAAKSKDGKYAGSGAYYTDYLKAIDDKIAALKKAVNDKYKANAAAGFKPDTTEVHNLFTAYATNAPLAVKRYDEVIEAVGKYNTALDAARAQFAELDIYTAENYDYKLKFDLILKDINKLQADVEDIIKTKKGADQWTDMKAAAKDNGDILARIKTLVDQKQSAINSLNGDGFKKELTGFGERIAKFNKDYATDGATKLGDDYGVYAGIENGIEADYTNISNAANIDLFNETVDYTAKVGTEQANWNVNNANKSHKEAGDNAITSWVAHYGDSKAADMLWQEVAVENGTYTVELYAFSLNPHSGKWSGDSNASLDGEANDVAYVFANGEKTWIKAHSGGLNEGEPLAYTINNVKVTDGKLKIGLHVDKADQTEWHGIQIKSLKANTTSLLEGWANKLTKAIESQEAIEATAKDVAAKVANNVSRHADLVKNIDAVQDKINNADATKGFIAKYKLGTDESSLGLRGKADGEITKAEKKINDDLTKLETENNKIVPTMHADVDKATDEITAKGKWQNGDVANVGSNNLVVNNMPVYEQWNGNADVIKQTGTVIKQTIKNLPNGIYSVELYAFACQGTAEPGSTSNVHVYANGKTAPVTVSAKKGDGNWPSNAAELVAAGGFGTYTINQVIVSDGTMDLGLAKDQGGTQWHGIRIKALNYHESSLNDTITKLEAKYLALAAAQTKLENDAPAIAAAVKANADAKTEADKQIAALTKYQNDNVDVLVNEKKNQYATKVMSDKYSKEAKTAGVIESNSFTIYADYAKELKVVTDSISDLNDSIVKYNASEQLVSQWNNVLKAQVQDATGLRKVMDDMVAKAQAEYENWFFYKNNLAASKKPYAVLSDSVTSVAAKIDATLTGDGALKFYSDSINQIKNDRLNIYKTIWKSINDKKYAADENSIKALISALQTKVNALVPDAKANKAKFDEQTKALAATKTLFNETYTNISTTDESELRDAYLKQLSAIQEEIAAAEKVVNESYPKGESVKNAQDFAALQNKITNVKTTQETGYIAQIQKENETAHANFLKEIEAAKAAYKDAADARANYRSSNDDIEDVIAKAAADLDVLLYDYKIIEKINAKVAEEAKAFAETESPTKFDADNAFVNAAKKFETDLVAAKKAFMDAVTGAITGYWTNVAGKTDGSTGGFWGQLKDANTAIAGLANADAKKDAFKDVEDILKAGDKAAAEASLAGVETAIESLKTITTMLAADKNAATLKDINLSVTASETKYTATIEKLATYGDDIVNNPKKDLTDAINAAYNGKDNAISVQSIKAAKDADKLSKYDTYAAALKAFLGQCDKAIETMDNAVKADQDNTKSYNAIIAEIVKIEGNLKTANDVVAQFKYYNDDLNANSISLMLQRYKANVWLENGKAKENETDAKKAATDELGVIKTNLETAISNEKLGLNSDITDLKNLYNQYVAQAGEDNATWKKNIADYEKALTDAATAGADFAKAVAAAQAILKIQNDIATLQSTIAKAYGNTANADVLASLNTSIATLEAKATIEGNDEWVKEQKLYGVTLAQFIADIQADIAAVKAEIAADEANIAFFKDKYEGKIADIETALKPVLDEIAAKQKQFNDDATAFAKFTAEFAELTAKLDAAKAKVDGYKYEGTEETDKYDMSWYTTNITTWIKNYTVYQDKDEKGNVIATRDYSLERMHELKNAQNFTYSQTYYGSTVDKAWLGDVIQTYLDYSAANEIWCLSADLNTDLVKAFDESTENLYSKTVWKQLLNKKKAIQAEINDLKFACDYSESNVEIKQTKAGVYAWDYVYDKDNNQIAKDRTSDADYAAQKATYDKIAQEIADFASEVANRKLGDVSGNGKIDTGDYSDIIDIIIGNVEAPEAGTEAFEAADINGDGNLNVIDATQVVNIILYGNPNGAAGARGVEAAELTIYDKMATDRIDNANEQVVLNAVSAENGIVRLALVLNNQNEYSNLQMDFVLPEGMTLVGQSLSLRATQTHEIVAGTVNGMNRILVMSAENAAFAGNAGNLLFLDVKVDNNYKGGDILFNNVILTDAQANYASFSVVNGETTGINAVMSESISGKIYNVGGKLMNGLKKGINIIRRNDGTTDKVVVK